MIRNAFNDWVVESIPGDGIIYHTGIQANEAPCANDAYDAAQLGLVALFQRKLRPSSGPRVVDGDEVEGGGRFNAFEYIAVRISPDAFAKLEAL